jgi:lysophospholipase L1-like esterase
MRRLRDRLRADVPNAQIVVASVLPVGDSFRRLTPQIDDLNDRLRALCADRSCTFLDVASAFDGEPEAISRDDLHLAEAGYTRWAAVLKPTLDEVL